MADKVKSKTVEAEDKPDEKKNKSRRGNRNQTRNESHRQAKNVQTESDYSKELSSRLASGFDLTSDVQKLGLSLRIVTTPIVITTRGVGFSSLFVHSKLAPMRNLPPGYNMYRLYRVGLAAVEGAVMATEKYASFASSEHVAQFATRTVDPRFLELIQLARLLPTPFSKIVNSIGEFETPVARYSPYFPPPRVFAGNLIPLPFSVTLRTLRQVVVRLADAQSPLNHRVAFYAANSLPGAVWLNPGVNPVLGNPDDFIPAGYDVIANLSQDINICRDVMIFLGKKYPKLTSEIARFDGKGDSSALLSNLCEGMRIPDMIAQEPVETYIARIATTGLFEGDIAEFWTTQSVPPANVVVGCTTLVGEVPTHAGYAYPYFAAREPFAKTHVVDQGFATSMTALY